MKATIGDQLHVHSRTVEETDRTGVILEVRGTDGGPPYLVRFDDGHERLVYPGGDCEVEQQRVPVQRVEGRGQESAERQVEEQGSTWR